MILRLSELRWGHWKKILFMTAFWTAAVVFTVLYDSVLTDFTSSGEGAQYHFWVILIYAVGTTIPAGFLLALFEIAYLSRVLRKKPYGTVLVTKTLIYVACIFVCNSFVMLLVYSSELGTGLLHSATWNQYLEGSIYTGMIFLRMVYWGFCVFLALFFVQISEKFGDGVLISFLLGKYHHPRVEHRIFMFLDLKSSTTLAEKLGHIRYSQLIQDCFFDLTDVATTHHARIYQYVGDEVVLTWETNDGIQNGHCVHTFFSYDAALQSREEYYMSRYGLVPEFKAALNAGPVTAAEVGEIKKELAYHGDVLNTAARIQGKCNELGCRLLVSETIHKSVTALRQYTLELVGDVMLKGKQRSVRIYSVEPHIASVTVPLQSLRDVDRT